MDDSDFAIVEALDEGQIRQLHDLYQGEWWSRGRSLDDVRRMVAGTDYVFGLCAASSGRLAGFARVLTDGVFKALVFDVIVDPALRNQGLGRRLIDAIVDHPVLAQVRHLELYCLPEMVPFYEQWGFSTDVAGTIFLRRRTRQEAVGAGGADG
jgi:GNAT superfamily N-acetyltransferase